MQTVIFPGSFDPITNGHLDIIAQAAQLFEQVDVLVMTNTAKNYLFDIDTRLQLVQEAVANWPNVQVLMRPAELTINAAHELGAGAIIRGVRNSEDFNYEQQIAAMNQVLDPAIKTVLLFTKPENSFVASSIIKEVAQFGGKISDFLPPAAAKALAEKMEFGKDD